MSDFNKIRDLDESIQISLLSEFCYKLGKGYENVELLGKREIFEATKDSGLII